VATSRKKGKTDLAADSYASTPEQACTLSRRPTRLSAEAEQRLFVALKGVSRGYFQARSRRPLQPQRYLCAVQPLVRRPHL